jgi:hypothetical protein
MIIIDRHCCTRIEMALGVRLPFSTFGFSSKQADGFGIHVYGCGPLLFASGLASRRNR